MYVILVGLVLACVLQDVTHHESLLQFESFHSLPAQVLAALQSSGIMQSVKNMAASAKEKVGNVTAKIEEKLEKSKASANEKVRTILTNKKYFLRRH